MTVFTDKSTASRPDMHDEEAKSAFIEQHPEISAVVPAWAERVTHVEDTTDDTLYRASADVGTLEVVTYISHLKDGTVEVDAATVNVDVSYIEGEDTADTAQGVRDLAHELLTVALRLDPTQEVTA